MIPLRHRYRHPHIGRSETAGLERTVHRLALTQPARLYITKAILAENAKCSRARNSKSAWFTRTTPPVDQESGQIVTPTRLLQVAKGADDNKFIECADAARADDPCPRQPEAFSGSGKKPKQSPQVHRHRSAAPCPEFCCGGSQVLSMMSVTNSCDGNHRPHFRASQDALMTRP